MTIMQTWIVATISKYVLVKARTEDEARARGLVELRRLFNREPTILVVRPQTEDERRDSLQLRLAIADAKDIDCFSKLLVSHEGAGVARRNRLARARTARQSAKKQKKPIAPLEINDDVFNQLIGD